MFVLLPVFLSVAYSQTPLTNYPGFFPYHLGPAYVTTSKLSYVYYIDQKPLLTQLNKLIDTSKAAHSRIDNSGDNFTENTLLPRLLDIDDQITNVKILFDNLQLSKDSRQKRGLIDLGGSIAKTLFGTLDADDEYSFALSLSLWYGSPRSQDSRRSAVCVFYKYLVVVREFFLKNKLDCSVMAVSTPNIMTEMTPYFDFAGYPFQD